jgi:hypothetical protein
MELKSLKKHRQRLLLSLCGCFILSFILAAVVMPPGFVFSESPIGYIDFMQHYSKADTFVEMVRQHGRTWGYNPLYMAGTPEISVYDLDNKWVELVVLVLSYLGISTVVAFKLLIFLEFLLEPFWVFLAFRNFGFSRKRSLWALLGGIMILNGPVGLFFNQVGMFSFVFSALFSFYAASLYYRFLGAGRPVNPLRLVMVTALAPLTHSMSVFMLGIPVLLMLLLRIRKLNKSHWQVMVSAAVVTVMVNMYWIVPFLKQYRYSDMTDPAWTGLISIRQGIDMWLIGILLTMGGLFAVLFLVKGISYMKQERRSHLALIVITMLAIITFFRFPGWYMARSIQPNRFLLLLLLYLLIPAVIVLDKWRLQSKGRLKTLTVVVLIVSLAVPAVGLTLVRFGDPGHSISRIIAKKLLGRRLGPGCLAEPETHEFIDWLNKNTSPEQGRIMIEHPQGEGTESPFLVFYSGLITGISRYVRGQFLGVPRFELPFQHNQLTRIDHLSMFGVPVKGLTKEDLLTRLNSYNVKWIVAVKGTITQYLDRFPELLRAVKTIALVTIYEVRPDFGYFIKGSGNIHSSLNRIALSGLKGDEVIIKYHWSPEFQTFPLVTIKPYITLQNPIGFIRLSNPPSEVILYYKGARDDRLAVKGDLNQ